VPSHCSSSISASTIAVGLSNPTAIVPSLEVTAAVENASLQTKSAFEQMMQQKVVTEEFELKL
jgi:hypothetical protein